MKFQFTGFVIVTVLFASCSNKENGHDASGTFEADEVIVSASANGKILSFNVDEGSVLAKDSIVGVVDPTNLSLQKQQVEASIQALKQQTINVQPQVLLLNQQLAVQQSQMNSLLHEKARLENLIKQDAATGKQLDDMNAQIEVLKKQMSVTQQQINVQKNNISTQNRSILSQGKPLQKQAAQIEDLLMKTNIRNPVNGTVLAKYAEAGEITSTGKAMYKIADLSYLNLRAYITGTQLPKIKLGQQVSVFTDDGKESFKQYAGTIIWISDKAEFTPKTIQTKEERANLVYAIKVKVKNDGYLKIGMYGEVGF
ncbi:MAG: HlyD family efflux transporter periplasmic adaptor subunit [Bacteroidetes bacterium]|nr:HlyD family efflux transporter periplasmic adaptor subunit [Bacteroidota bacterium]MBS1930240.1 HlyD family efflux transporter periplasmic adaptor subunit [Bacteroidota bacterium]